MNRKLNPVKINNQKYEMIPNADNKSINHKVHRENYTKVTKVRLLGYLLCVLCVLPTGA